MAVVRAHGGLVWASWELDQHGSCDHRRDPAALPSFHSPVTSTWETGPRVSDQRAWPSRCWAFWKHRDGQGDRRPDRPEARHQPAVPERRGGQPGRAASSSAIPAPGSLTRSAINQQAGACTQWSGVISAVAVALTVLLVAPFAYYIPKSAAGGHFDGWRPGNSSIGTSWSTTCGRRVPMLDRGLTAVAAVAISVEFCILIGRLSFVRARMCRGRHAST